MANIKINSTPTRAQYTATSGQTVFAYNFPIKADSDLKVYKRASGSTPDDTADLLTLTTDYTVTGADTASGGTVVLVTGATTGDIVTIVGDKAIDRNAIYTQSATISKADLNNDFNDNVMFDKQTSTLIEQLTPSYNRSELIYRDLDTPANNVRADNLYLPILDDGYIWVGRGNLGDSPDDIQAVEISTISGGVLNADYVIGTDNAGLPDAQVLGGQGTGLVYSTDNGTTGTVTTLGVGQGLQVLAGDLVATGGGGTTEIIDQVGHTLNVGDWVRFNGVIYTLANASNSVNGEVIGVVSETTTDTFTLQQAGFIDDLGSAPYLNLTPGQVYYLDTVDGRISTTEPSNVSEVSRPCLLATGIKSGWIYPYRGQIQGNGGTATSLPEGSNKIVITQPGHTFNNREWLRVDTATTFATAKADTLANSRVVGVVTQNSVDGDADKFILQTGGYCNELSGLTADTQYYLSETAAGTIDPTEPTILSSYKVPVIYMLGTTSGFININTSLPVADADEAKFISATQAGGFAVNKVLSFTGGVYAEAQADSLANARNVVGIVVYNSGNDFIIQTAGYTDKLTGVTQNSMHYLSAGSAGAFTTTEPTTSGQVSMPLFVGLSTTEAVINIKRPMEQPNANGGAGGGAGSFTLLEDYTVSGPIAIIPFDDVFTSTYKYYRIILLDMVVSSATVIAAEFGTGTGPVTYSTSNYEWRSITGASATASGNMLLHSTSYDATGASSISGVIEVFNPTNASYYKQLRSQMNYSSASTVQLDDVHGQWRLTTALTSIRITRGAAGNFTAGRILIYGQNI